MKCSKWWAAALMLTLLAGCAHGARPFDTVGGGETVEERATRLRQVIGELRNSDGDSEPLARATTLVDRAMAMAYAGDRDLEDVKRVLRTAEWAVVRGKAEAQEKRSASRLEKARKTFVARNRHAEQLEMKLEEEQSE